MATAAGLALTAAQTVIAAVESKVLKEFLSNFGFTSELEKLKGTMSSIKALLEELDDKQLELTGESELWINNLKDALYDVDDLLDEVKTEVEQQGQTVDGFLETVRRAISAYLTSQQIKDIRDKLDACVDDHIKFGLKMADYKSIWSKRQRTSSFVNENKIIGRDGDREKIVCMLLDSGVEKEVSYVTIVGMGGLGKTALAQLVYKDARIQSQFQRRLWVCVSVDFSLEDILGQILMSLANEKSDGLGLDQLQNKVLEHIKADRFLLVLDDVWEESRLNWVDLQNFLAMGRKGSKVLVTSRSKKVSNAIGNHPMHELQGLSPEGSLQLFKLMALENGGEDADARLVEIAQDIVKKCSNVPLSIRVVGSLLFGQGIDEWLSFQENDLAKIQKAKDSEDSTVATLKFSYYHLIPQLKSCFSYCALFPKDHPIEKDQLIGLWMANGCIEPQFEGQSIEDVGEQYFWLLVQRCFFQDLTEGRYTTCKVHDLIHDLALETAGHESSMLSSVTSQLAGKVRHLSISPGCSVLSSTPYDFSPQKEMLRTFLQTQNWWNADNYICELNAVSIISNCRRLRWLDLKLVPFRSVPSGVGELIHLRCLDLSCNYDLEKLPESITSLCNLQILKLTSCGKLRALPEHLSRLVNLRHLDIHGCDSITCMPTGLKNLTCLRRLPMFVLGGDSKKAQMSQLEDLKALENLSDALTIKVINFSSEERSQVMEGGYLWNKPRLEFLNLSFEGNDKVDGDAQEAILEGLQPAKCNLKSMNVVGYSGVKLLQSWETTLSHLVSMHLDNLHKVQDLPLLSQLGELKRLYVGNIPNLEYMENDSNCTPSVGPTFFPSLEVLTLEDLPTLKGWWRDGIIVDWEAQKELEGNGEGSNKGGENGYGISSSHIQYFPRLYELAIEGCSNMKSFPPCPHVKILTLTMANEDLKFWEKRGMVEENNGYNLVGGSKGVSYSNNSSGVLSPSPSPLLAFKELTSNIGFMRRLPEESFRALTTLQISYCEEQSLSGIERVFRGCASSLQSLQIRECKKLKRLSGGGLEHLTSLRRLAIGRADELEMEENGTPWNSLHALTHLTLRGLPKMENLPEGLQYLTALQSLHILWCPKLTSLPEGLRDLNSLTTLEIWGCPALRERCREPDGEDYPKISHIPHIHVSRNTTGIPDSTS